MKIIIDASWSLEDITTFINKCNGILEDVQIECVILINNNYTIDKLYIFNCTILGEICVQDINYAGFSISVKNSAINRFAIYDSKIFSLNIYDSDIKNIHINDVTIINGSKIDIDNISNLQIYDTKGLFIDINIFQNFKGHIRLDAPEIRSTITSYSTKTRIDVDNVDSLVLYGSFDQIRLEQFNDIEISSYIDKITKESYKNINKISLEAKNIKGTLLVENFDIKELTFLYFLNSSGIIAFNNLCIHKTVIQNSILGNIYLNNIHFKTELEITGSDISKINYSNVKWLSKTYISLFDDLFLKNFLNKEERADIRKDIDELKSNREVFRQLKLAATSMQNHIDVMEFHRLEMRLYWKDIRFTKSAPWQNRVLVFIDRVVSDFGQNWWLPLIWLVCVHFVLFFCIFQWNFSFDIQDFKNGLGEYFTLLNPVHTKPDYINTGMGLFTDFWMRILSGFFIYHFIRATRRYGKM